MINKTNKKLITFTDRNIEMMEAISAQSGWNTPGEICKRGIEELYSKYFPAYRTASGANNQPVSEEAILKNAEIKAKAKIVVKKTEEDIKLASKKLFCELNLGGEVEERNDGVKICRFTQYSADGADQTSIIPLAQVDPVIVKTSLFLPSRELVFKARPEVEKMFKKLAIIKRG